MVEYITKDDAMMLLLYVKEETDDIDTSAVSVFRDELIGMPAVEVAHVIHAYWDGVEGDGNGEMQLVYEVFECSNCGCEHHADGEPRWAYCPDCGAKMDLEPPIWEEE